MGRPPGPRYLTPAEVRDYRWELKQDFKHLTEEVEKKIAALKPILRTHVMKELGVYDLIKEREDLATRVQAINDQIAWAEQPWGPIHEDGRLLRGPHYPPEDQSSPRSRIMIEVDVLLAPLYKEIREIERAFKKLDRGILIANLGSNVKEIFDGVPETLEALQEKFEEFTPEDLIKRRSGRKGGGAKVRAVKGGGS